MTPYVHFGACAPPGQHCTPEPAPGTGLLAHPQPAAIGIADVAPVAPVTVAAGLRVRCGRPITDEILEPSPHDAEGMREIGGADPGNPCGNPENWKPGVSSGTFLILRSFTETLSFSG